MRTSRNGSYPDFEQKEKEQGIVWDLVGIATGAIAMSWRSREDIKRYPEYTDFISKVAAFHRDRGTPFEPEPWVGPKIIDVYDLYNRVTQAGGYDKVSEKKGLWKAMAENYDVPVPKSNAGYLLKKIYYRYLVAYEITNYWHEIPPPPSILEEISVKGGGVRGRTLENYDPNPSRSQRLESPVIEEGNVRPTLLRLGPRRPPPKYDVPSSAYKVNNQASKSSCAAAYIPRAPILGSVPNNIHLTGVHPQIVSTPFVHPQTYNTIAFENRPIGHGLSGAPRLTRISLAIKSGLESEVDWALHQFVKASFDDNDEIRIDSVPGLCDVIFDKLESLDKLLRGFEGVDLFTSEPFQTSLAKILEAALVLRNFSLSADNARYISKNAASKHILEKLFRLISNHTEVLFELQLYILDVTEAISSYIKVEESDVLYITLNEYLESNDRSILISALRSLARLAVQDEANSLLHAIKPETIERIQLFLLLPDTALVDASLDFLYQYTSYIPSAKDIMESEPTSLLSQLIRLTTHDATERVRVLNLKKRKRESAPPLPPPVPSEVMQELLEISEPERAIKWMKISFDESPDDDITQIQLWQSYQQKFSQFVSVGRPLLPAADLIKNINQAYPKAKAMVVGSPEGQKFIIRGMRPRETARSLQGQSYLQCRWLIDDDNQICRTQHANTALLLKHIMEVHNPDGNVCRWSNCTSFRSEDVKKELAEKKLAQLDDRKLLTAHILTHIPTKEMSSLDVPSYGTLLLRTRQTATNETGDATGLALTAALVLRNLARSNHKLEVLASLEHNLFDVASENEPITPYLIDVITAVQNAGH